MFSLESTKVKSEMKRNRSVRSNGSGDGVYHFKPNPKNEEFSKNFQEIQSLVNRLESSLLTSRKLEQEEMLRSSMLIAENKRLLKQIELLNSREPSEEEGYCSLNTTSRDNFEPCETMSIVSLQYKYNELHTSYQKILETLTDRDKHIRSLKLKIHNLEDAVLKKQQLCLEKDSIVHELCIKYLRLKNNRDLMQHSLQNELDCLHLALKRATTVLAENVLKHDNLIQEELYKTVESREALLLQEIRNNNRLTHENEILQQKIEYMVLKNCIR